VERLIQVVVGVTERAAGFFLAAIVALTFTSIMLRAFFNTTIPDWFDLSRLFLGIAIFWGIASTSYRDEHIQVDFLWESVGPRAKWLIDLFATTVLLAFLVAFSWMLVLKVNSGFRSGEATFDVRIQIWPFHMVAALGIFLATVLVAIRLVRICRGRGDTSPRRIEPVQ
jgi:TRAP-type C4-dicarboxylate transport system permease small subunit